MNIKIFLIIKALINKEKLIILYNSKNISIIKYYKWITIQLFYNLILINKGYSYN